MQNINEALKGNIETISKEVSTSKEELDNKEVLIQKYKVRKKGFSWLQLPFNFCHFCS